MMNSIDHSIHPLEKNGMVSNMIIHNRPFITHPDIIAVTLDINNHSQKTNLNSSVDKFA